MTRDQSKPVPLEAEAVEAAAKAMFIPAEVWRDERDAARFIAAAERGIHAFLDAMEMTVEERFSSLQQVSTGIKDRYRLVSAWFPIKGPVDE